MKRKRASRLLALIMAGSILTSTAPSVIMADETETVAEDTDAEEKEEELDEDNDKEDTVIYFEADSASAFTDAITEAKAITSGEAEMLIVKTDDMEKISVEELDAEIVVEGSDNISILYFDSKEELKEAEDELGNDGVAYFSNDEYLIETNETKDAAAKIKEIDFGTAKREVKVAVLDTGYDLSNGDMTDILPGYDVTGEENLQDAHGHGSYMADIVRSNSCDGVKIIPVKVADDNGKSSTLRLVLGMEYALEQKVDVVNISMTCFKPADSSLIEEEINKLSANGITVVVAAGNYSSNTADFVPANVDSALTISAVNNDEDYTFASYSNFGADVDFSAVGSINAKGINCEEKMVSGTSVAAAYATAFLSNMKATSENDLNREEILEKAKETAIDKGSTGYDDYYGNGVLAYKEALSVDNEKEEDSDKEEDKDIEDEETENDNKPEDGKVQDELPEILKCDWKNMDTESLNELIFVSDYSAVKVFYEKLSESDKKELLGREDIILNRYFGYVKFDNSKGGDNDKIIDSYDGTLLGFLYSDVFDVYEVQGVETGVSGRNAYIALNTNKNTTRAYMRLKVDSSGDKSSFSKASGGAFDMSGCEYKGTSGRTLVGSTYTQWWFKGMKTAKEAHQYLYGGESGGKWWSQTHDYSGMTSGGWMSNPSTCVSNYGCSSTSITTTSFAIGSGDLKYGSTSSYTSGVSLYQMKFSNAGVTVTHGAWAKASDATCTEKEVDVRTSAVKCEHCSANKTSAYNGKTCPDGNCSRTINSGKESKNVGSALGHNWKLSSSTGATCTSASTENYTCSRCKATDIKHATAALGHDSYLASSTDATCTSTSRILLRLITSKDILWLHCLTLAVRLGAITR